MEKNNKRLTIIVASLLVVIGISFAYFMASLLIEGEGVRTKVTTARISGATLHVEGTIDMEDTNMMPGHKAVSAVKVTATGNNQLIAYNLIWSGTNGISQINYKVYKGSNPLTPKPETSCTPTTKVEGGVQQLSETCSISNFEGIGEPIASGSINKGDTKVVLVEGEFITATSGGTSWYYYVVLEYPNLEIDQSGDIGASITGEVSVEESDKEADINILAVYVAEEDGVYKETTDIPKKGEGYGFTRAECSNEAMTEWDNIKWGIVVTNLTKSGTSCNLYFSKAIIKTVDDILGLKPNPSGDVGSFSDKSADNEATIEAANDDYGVSYYYRGAVTNNYVRFAGYCWRIVRINGNNSIRLIYDGDECHANGVSTIENFINNGTKSAFNSIEEVQRDNAGVGYMYGEIGVDDYDRTHANSNDSAIKEVLDAWYTSSIEERGYGGYIDEEAGFCNDRTVSTVNRSINFDNYMNEGYGKKKTAYAAADRFLDERLGSLSTQKPTLKCASTSKNLFTVNNSSSTNKGNKALSKPIGLITADEVVFAGGFSGINNDKFYLYNGNYYWTMTPTHFRDNAISFLVTKDGFVTHTNNVSWSIGVRPVINLKAGTTFIGVGNKDNPYVVV